MFLHGLVSLPLRAPNPSNCGAAAWNPAPAEFRPTPTGPEPAGPSELS